MFGYLFTFLLVSRHFGTLGGILAGSALALSEYGLTNLCVRGDMSEFAAMNIIPSILFFVDGSLRRPNALMFSGVAFANGAIIVTHPCIALPGFTFLAIFLVICLMVDQIRPSAFFALVAMALTPA
ncbi:MAG: hypothetical protein R3C59_28730 [Planctomycetaceae bacterium]